MQCQCVQHYYVNHVVISHWSDIISVYMIYMALKSNQWIWAESSDTQTIASTCFRVVIRVLLKSHLLSFPNMSALIHTFNSCVQSTLKVQFFAHMVTGKALFGASTLQVGFIQPISNCRLIHIKLQLNVIL